MTLGTVLIVGLSVLVAVVCVASIVLSTTAGAEWWLRRRKSRRALARAPENPDIASR